MPECGEDRRPRARPGGRTVAGGAGRRPHALDDGVLYTPVGPEIGVASTKSFTGQLVALYRLAVHLGRTKGARGINYPVALEGALKLKELAYAHAEGCPAGEMKHGPIALVDPKLPVVVLAPNDRLYRKVIGDIEEVRARHGLVAAVASDGDDDIATRADHVRDVVQTSELLTPILCAIPLQLLAYHIAVLRDCDVDQPRNLAKSVTVE